MPIRTPAVARRFPLLVLGLLALVGGLVGGLVRIGWSVPHTPAPLPLAHGPLMVCGFLGTLIGLERAVALGRGWPYMAPVLTGLGGLVVLAGVDGWPGPLLFAMGSLALVAVFGVLLRMQVQSFALVMALGALAWVVGNGLWLSGATLARLVPWWMGFLVLTIVGERLELSRMLFHPPRVTRLFLGIAGLLVVALIVTSLAPDVGMRLVGVALVAMGVWLFRYDVARRTVRQTGLTRFIAVCLLAGFGWLVVGGGLALAVGFQPAGPLYDAVLHAVFVGFVFSMIFGHAPIIFPSVLGVPVSYRPVYYVHLGLLHASLVLRLWGDLGGAFGLRRWGGLLNAAAIGLFLLVTVVSTVLARRARRARSALSATPS